MVSQNDMVVGEIAEEQYVYVTENDESCSEGKEQERWSLNSDDVIVFSNWKKQ